MSTVQEATPSVEQPPRRRRFRVWWVVLALLVLVLAFGAIAGLKLLKMLREGEQAQNELTAFKTALKAGDPQQARPQLAAAKRDIAAAEASYHSWSIKAAGWIPILGQPVHDAGHLLTAARLVSRAGDDALGLYDQIHGNGSKLFHDNTVDLAEVRVVTQQATGMVDLMTTAQAELHKVKGWSWEPKVAHARDNALRQVSTLRQQGVDAEKLLKLVPPAVGADGPKTYLIVVLNPAELQNAGGSALSMMAARFVNGRMKIIQAGATSDLTNLNSPGHWRPLPEDPWLKGDVQQLAAADRSPDWRTSGRELMRGYEAQFGRHVDGVVALDPIAMQDLMPQIGSFTTPGYGVVDAGNLAHKVLIDSYTLFTDRTLRHDYNQALMNEMLHRILGGGHMIGKFKALSDAAKAGHVQVLMDDPGLQEQVVKADALRVLPPPVGDVVGVYTANTNASKTDVWQKRTVDQKVTVNADGSVDVVRTVTVTNAAPPYAGPGADIGTGYTTRVMQPRITDYFNGSAKIRSIRVNGQRAGWLKFRERGLLVASVNPVRLNPGQKAVVVMRYRLPAGTAAGGTYRLAVAAQPTYLPVRLTLSVGSSAGCRAAAAGWTVTGKQARLAQPMAPMETTLRCGAG